MAKVVRQMIPAAFLMCALSLNSPNFTHQPILSWHVARSEEDALADELRKNGDIEDVFITPKGDRERLRNYSWDRLPWTINGKEIWIQRKPKSDQRLKGAA